MDNPRRLRELTRHQALRLLGSVPMGRIVFTVHAMPAIRPINHELVDGDVVIRCHDGAAVWAARGQVVAYEADAIDAETRTGWSVIVTGIAVAVTDAGEVHRYERLVTPWLEGDLQHVLRIRSEFVTGYEFVAPGPERATAGVR